ncbi:hypothetical protein LTR64_005193 [Lithohypha guttulata]|uniref:uncharacterized protein n=1 Tax=Lithohypha guttulata TaxID=1690604 RepID=UPI002DDFD308|nr:hypothetical protein LTR51_003013 [Lithohypha guttulata]
MASPAQFFDPFFVAKPKLGKFAKSAPGRTAHLVKTEHGDTVQPITLQRTDELPIKGQGTIAVRSSAQNVLHFAIISDLAGGPSLHLEIGPRDILLFYEDAAGRNKIDYIDLKSRDASFLNIAAETTYWLSVDSNNGWLRYGKHFTNKTMTLIEATLKHKDQEGVMVWNDVEKYRWLETVKTIEVTQDKGNILSPVVSPVPIVMDLPPFVRTSDQITLSDIENGFFTAPINLPDACQKLYGNIAGAKIVLNDDDFPNFSDAIQHSCITPGCWAFEKLQEKANAGELGHDLAGTYLRITLGYNQGDSPGIPYVLEIWPASHHSPIHDHGDACAVIKVGVLQLEAVYADHAQVLHGAITCTWYESLETTAWIGQPATLSEGQITWISPEQYQIHKLQNDTATVCCTIRCYRYMKTDNVHYDGFNWRDDNGKSQKFVPNSDTTFTDFRNIMKAEWTATLSRNGTMEVS